MTKLYSRPAIAMIELIFAIVIMGIVMLASPMLISTANNSAYVSIQQENINEVATQLNMILGYQWDEENTNEAYDPIVLQVTNGDSNLSELGTSGRRAGTPYEGSRKFISNSGEKGLATAIGSEAGDLDDIDDFNGKIVNLTQAQTGGTADYIETTLIDMTHVVKYLHDNITGGTYSNPTNNNGIVFRPVFDAISPAGTTNIKHIQVKLTTRNTEEDLNKTITFHAFSCNIGSAALEERP